MNHGSSVAVEGRDEREQLFAALYTIWSDLKKVSLVILPRREARAVCHETRWTSSSSAAVSRQQLIQCDRQVTDANARGVIDGIGDGRSGADDPDFANAFRTHRIDMRGILIDPGHVDGADIGVGRDVVLGEGVVHGG